MRYEAAMDLSKLPVTMNNIRRSEKEAITKDREMWWETFYSKVGPAALEIVFKE